MTENALTNYGENQVLEWVLNTSGNKYVALFTTAVGEDGSGTEASGTWYSRQLSSFTVTGDQGVTSSILDFGEVTDTPVTISHWAVYDAATAGNPWVYGAFEATKTASVGTNIIIQPGDIIITAK